jgi:hypothetical protein
MPLSVNSVDLGGASSRAVKSGVEPPHSMSEFGLRQESGIIVSMDPESLRISSAYSV